MLVTSEINRLEKRIMRLEKALRILAEGPAQPFSAAEKARKVMNNGH